MSIYGEFRSEKEAENSYRYVRVPGDSGKLAYTIPLLRADEVSAFEVEVEQAFKQDLAVEWAEAGDLLLVWVELMGEYSPKSKTRRAFRDILEQRGLETETVAEHRIARTVGQMGRLISDVAGYVPPNYAGDYPDTDNHGDIVVEIDWLDESAAALEKVPRYFNPGFLGPKGSFVKEVWCVLIPRAKPPLQAELLVNGPAAPLDAFTGVPPLPAGAAEQTVIVYHSRGNAAFPPCMSLVEWNTTISVPAGSLCPGGGFDANGVLRRMYRGRT